MKYYQFKESCSNGTCGSRGATALSALKDYYSKGWLMDVVIKERENIFYVSGKSGDWTVKEI